MTEQKQENAPAVRPQSISQGCAYLIALALVAVIEIIEAIPYHLSFYAWCAWYFTGGQIRLHFLLWQIRLEQKRIRNGNPYYRKHVH